MEQSLQRKEGVHEGQPGAMSKPERVRKVYAQRRRFQQRWGINY